MDIEEEGRATRNLKNSRNPRQAGIQPSFSKDPRGASQERGGEGWPQPNAISCALLLKKKMTLEVKSEKQEVLDPKAYI